MKDTAEKQLKLLQLNCARRGDSFFFPWETKEGYLEFRDAWRAEYRLLSEIIGSSRRAFRRRRRSDDGFEIWRSKWTSLSAFAERRKRRIQLEDEAASLSSLSSYATFLMELRMKSKEHAQVCYLKHREAATA